MNKRAGLGLAVAGVLLCALAAQAQANAAFGPELSGAEPSRDGQSREGKQRPLPDRLPDKPSVPPAFTIPIEPIGFTAPGPIYLGARNSMASLDFLDENRLLFTFRVPGLMRREAGASAGSDERQIRAVVVVLPEGKVESEALWTVHDRVRYLWMLKDAHFLLRDRDGLQEGDAKLELKPLLQFPGPLLWVELDPTQHFMVTNSREPALAATGDLADGQKTGQPSLGRSDQVKPDRQADLAKTDAGKTDAGKTDLVLRLSLIHICAAAAASSTGMAPTISEAWLTVVSARPWNWSRNWMGMPKAAESSNRRSSPPVRRNRRQFISTTGNMPREANRKR